MSQEQHSELKAHHSHNVHHNKETETKSAKKKNKTFLVVLIILLTVGGIFGYSKYLHNLKHEATDDAQIDAGISPVIPRISGYVTEIRVKDNQRVKKGDTLVVLDNSTELIQLAQTEAALNVAKSNLNVANAQTNVSKSNIVSYQANITTAESQIEAAKITLKRAAQDYDRYVVLYNEHSITQQQFEQAEAAKQSAEKQLQVFEDQKNATQRQTNSATSQFTATSQQISVANATIKQKQVDVDNAKLNLSYTVITAPTDGMVSKVNVQLGQLLQVGQLLFSIVTDQNPWVIANFKETQLAKMKMGQKVTVNVDAIPNHKFDATITSFSPATGARFALLPPDNASGNFVRVVQRLPVKIEFTDNDEFVKRLRPGMNVDVDVHID